MYSWESGVTIHPQEYKKQQKGLITMDKERTLSNKYTDFSQLPLILTPMDIKEILGISRSNAYALCHSKDFPAMRIGKLIRISKEEFIEWVKKVEYVSLEA